MKKIIENPISVNFKCSTEDYKLMKRLAHLEETSLSDYLRKKGTNRN